MTDTPPPAIVQNIVTKVDSEYELLAREVKLAIADAVKVGGSTLAVLGVIEAALPHVGLPGADLASVTGIVTGATGAVSYLLRLLIKARTA